MTSSPCSVVCVQQSGFSVKLSEKETLQISQRHKKKQGKQQHEEDGKTLNRENEQQSHVV